LVLVVENTTTTRKNDVFNLIHSIVNLEVYMSSCTCCGVDLSIAIRSADNTLKSCPRCSQTHGSLHIFRRLVEDFGFTDRRVTANNPDGVHSHCIDCRNKGPGEPSSVDLSHEIKCNMVAKA
jgi:hypothetical protein